MNINDFHAIIFDLDGTREFDSCIKMKSTKASHRLIFLSNFSFFTFVPYRTVL
jgi:hypothetical protein